MGAILLKILIIIIFAVIIFIGVSVLFKYWKQTRRQKQLFEIIEQYQKVLYHTGISALAAVDAIDKHYSKYDVEDIEANIVEILYRIYLAKESAMLKKECVNTKRYDLYVKYLKERNTKQAFYELDTVDIYAIISRVDSIEKEKATIVAKNKNLFAEFWNETESLIQNKKIVNRVKSELTAICLSEKEIDKEELLDLFNKYVHEIGFKWEFDCFLMENSDKIEDVRDFCSDDLLAVLKAQKQYEEYEYSKDYDRSWMLCYLIAHMTERKTERQALELLEKEERANKESLQIVSTRHKTRKIRKTEVVQ